jgi:hypothetical protein
LKFPSNSKPIRDYYLLSTGLSLDFSCQAVFSPASNGTSVIMKGCNPEGMRN